MTGKGVADVGPSSTGLVGVRNSRPETGNRDIGSDEWRKGKPVDRRPTLSPIPVCLGFGEAV
ncbi:hypothetical protein Droror1_Dr00010269, partial [Drosera rotundifolia]